MLDNIADLITIVYVGGLTVYAVWQIAASALSAIDGRSRVLLVVVLLVVIGLAVLLVGQLLEIRNQRVGFSEMSGPLTFDTVQQASTDGLVSAALELGKKGERVTLCGYVSANREDLVSKEARRRATLLANASAHIRTGGPKHGVHVTGASLLMPVRVGEYWIITTCAGEESGKATTYFHGLTQQ